MSRRVDPVNYRPLDAEFKSMIAATYGDQLRTDSEQYVMLRKSFYAGALAIANLASEGKVVLALEEIEDFTTELKRGY